jgi:hypothetical protein
MSDDLVERVALAFCGKDVPCKMCRNDAKKAIAIALEEAAKVADENACDCCFYIAAAIRAMIPNGNDRAPDDTGSAE